MTGALLSPGLSAAAGNFGSGQSGLGALALVGKIVLDNSVNSNSVGFDAKQSIAQFDLANCLAGHVININLRHCSSSSL